MNKLCIFAGTTEGRRLVERLCGRGCGILVCTATEYGGGLVDGLARVTSLVGPLDAEAKERLVAEHDFACIVDATHPYATHVTQSIAALAEAHELPLLRLVRDEDDGGCYTLVPDVQEAAEYVAHLEGNVMLTTGAKDLATFVEAMPDFEERLFVRILPVEASVTKAHELGIPASRIIAMQGPFSFDMNVATMRQYGILIDRCGAELVVIQRPEGQEGLLFGEVQAELARMLGVSHAAKPAAEKEVPASSSEEPSPRMVYLVGIGLGNPDTLTIEAAKAIGRSDLLIGAKRMLEPYESRTCQKLALIKSDDIVEALRRSDAQRACVLFSGDVGFYSGATALSEKLRSVEGLEVRSIPGISSVVCLCARLLTPWQDVHLVSAHGRECDPVEEVRTNAKTFMLTGGKTKARDVCALLVEAGLGDVIVHVGERLSYDDERIVNGTAAELAQQEFLDLAVMLVENPAVPKYEPGKLES